MGERVLLIGESNPYGSDPRFALYPEPPGCAGARLCAILGYTKREYLRLFDRCNLLSGPRWSAPEARRAAEALDVDYRVLLGARVAAAHGLTFEPFCNVQDNGLGDCYAWRGVMLPHPSGRSRLWNDYPQAVARARGLVRDLVRLAYVSRAEEGR